MILDDFQTHFLAKLLPGFLPLRICEKKFGKRYAKFSSRFFLETFSKADQGSLQSGETYAGASSPFCSNCSSILEPGVS